MANPNILNLTSIVGKSNTFALSTGAATTILSGSVNSLIKVNNIIIGNMDGATAYGVNVGYYNGSTSLVFANNVSVPAQSILSLVDKTASFYLEESHYLYANTSISNKLNMVVSYEVLT